MHVPDVVDGTEGAAGGEELVEAIEGLKDGDGVELVALTEGLDDGDGVELGALTEGLDDGDGVELVEVIAADEGEILVEVEEEAIVREEAPVEVGEEAIVDEPLTDTEGVVDDKPLGKVLELTDGLADVTKVVNAAAVAVDDARLDASVPAVGSSLAGIVMI